MKLNLKVLVPLIFLLLSGCGINEVKISGNEQILKRAVPEFKSGQTVNIKNYYLKPTIINNPIRASNDQIDAQEFSAAAIRIVRQAMAYRDINVTPKGNKSIKIRVYDVKWGSKKGESIWALQGGSIELTAELGNGSVINVYQFNHKKQSFSQTYDRIILSATEKLLNHPDFISYMNK